MYDSEADLEIYKGWEDKVPTQTGGGLVQKVSVRVLPDNTKM